MDFFIREAWAQDAAMGGGDTTAMLVQFGPLILIFAIFYFLIITPYFIDKPYTILNSYINNLCVFYHAYVFISVLIL